MATGRRPRLRPAAPLACTAVNGPVTTVDVHRRETALAVRGEWVVGVHARNGAGRRGTAGSWAGSSMLAHALDGASDALIRTRVMRRETLEPSSGSGMARKRSFLDAGRPSAESRGASESAFVMRIRRLSAPAHRQCALPLSGARRQVPFRVGRLLRGAVWVCGDAWRRRGLWGSHWSRRAAVSMGTHVRSMKVMTRPLPSLSRPGPTAAPWGRRLLEGAEPPGSGSRA